MINFLIAVGVLVVLAVLVSTLAKIGKFGNNPRTGTIFFTYKDKTFALRRAKNK